MNSAVTAESSQIGLSVPIAQAGENPESGAVEKTVRTVGQVKPIADPA